MRDEMTYGSMPIEENQRNKLALHQQEGRTAAKTKFKFKATASDGLFALIFWCLGILFYDIALTSFDWSGIGTLFFTLFYCAAVLSYAHDKGYSIPKFSWYWLILLACMTVSFVLWPSGSLIGYKELAFLLVAVYWSGSVFCVNLKKSTSNFIALDGINMLLCIPFSNFPLTGMSLASLLQRFGKKKKDQNPQMQRVLSIGLGLLLCIPVFVIVIPLLLNADSGRFTSFWNYLYEKLHSLFTSFFNFSIYQIIIGSVMGWYMFALVGGCANGRYTKHFNLEKENQRLSIIRKIPHETILFMLLGIVGLYLLFIGMQIPYFFSAFGGALPAGYASYSEYARSGFFELCIIAAINLCILLFANMTSRKPRVESKHLQWLNILLSILTLILIITAFSKMGLYIMMFGLTPKRVLTSVFMLMLAGIWLGIIALQFRSFSIVRYSAILCSIIFCILCLSNMDGWIQAYNAMYF